MHGSGNDFILIDEFSGIIIPEERKPEFVSKIADRHLGVGADGVIFIQDSERYDAKFSFYNPDGSKAEMCGNGIRCFSRYLYERGIVKKRIIDIETLSGLIRAELFIENNKVKEVRVNMGVPRLKRGEIPVSGNSEEEFINEPIEIDGKTYRITAVSIGNPHAVLFFDDIERIDVADIGRKIRFYEELFPNGINVHFVQRIRENEFKIRSYERGVEDETLACGSGICASAVASFLNNLTSEKKIKFHTRGGELRVELETRNGEISGVYLIGGAVFVFEGVLSHNFM